MIERWTGKPDGWWAHGLPCGHNHGVTASKTLLKAQIFWCSFKHLRVLLIDGSISSGEA